MQLPEDIKQLNMTDKFMILEQLWDDMSKNVEDSRFTPEWHLEILNKLEEKEKNNSLQFSDLEDSKKKLQSLVKK